MESEPRLPKVTQLANGGMARPQYKYREVCFQIDPLGITGLRKVDILTVLVYYTERMHIKMSKANKLMRKVQEKPDTSFQGSPTPRSGVAQGHAWFSQQ